MGMLRINDFCQFSAFVEFYSERTNDSELRKAGKFIKFAKTLGINVLIANQFY